MLAQSPFLNFLVSAHLAEIIYLLSWSISSRPAFLCNQLIRHKLSRTFLRCNCFWIFLYVISLVHVLFESTILQVWPNRYKYLLDSNLDCLGPSHSAPHIASYRALLATMLFSCLTSSHEQLKWVRAFPQHTTTAVITSHHLCVQLVHWLSKQNDEIVN